MYPVDVHVTEALHALSALDYPHVSFVFCGGTSLSKAHGLIERMSEDVDLKVVLTEDHGLSRSGVRSHLSDLKKLTMAEMARLGFIQAPEGLKPGTKTGTSQRPGCTNPGTRATTVFAHT
jgi:hypothetical protein